MSICRKPAVNPSGSAWPFFDYENAECFVERLRTRRQKSWPTQTNNEFGIADKLNSVPKYVVSSTLNHAGWNNSTLIKTGVTAEITHLKQQSGGHIAITGSATLVQSLMQADLIDEYRLLVHPVVVGTGKRLFKDRAEM